jgi:uncharacterized membrane protein
MNKALPCIGLPCGKVVHPCDKVHLAETIDVRAPSTSDGMYVNPDYKIPLRLAQSVFAIAIVVLFTACGGSLSDEQRKKLREGMQDHKITQLSDNEIVTAAMDEGRSVFDALEKSHFDVLASQRIARERKVKVRFITPGAGDALEVENQIIQAYIVGSATGATQDNIQKLRSGTSTSLQDYDTLLYSRPIVTTQPDGSVNVEGVWNVYVAKRDIVRGLSNK